MDKEPYRRVKVSLSPDSRQAVELALQWVLLRIPLLSTVWAERAVAHQETGGTSIVREYALDLVIPSTRRLPTSVLPCCECLSPSGMVRTFVLARIILHKIFVTGPVKDTAEHRNTIQARTAPYTGTWRGSGLKGLWDQNRG